MLFIKLVVYCSTKLFELVNFISDYWFFVREFFMDTHKRSIAKAFTFRIIATITTVILVLIFTNSLALAGIIGILDLSSKLILYYIHERAWDKVSWGLRRGI